VDDTEAYPAQVTYSASTTASPGSECAKDIMAWATWGCGGPRSVRVALIAAIQRCLSALAGGVGGDCASIKSCAAISP
jgi:hypothetical protein